MATSAVALVFVMPWEEGAIELRCKYHVIFLTTAATVSILKIVPLTLDTLVRVIDFTFYHQFYSKSPYNHLLFVVVVFEVKTPLILTYRK